MSGEQKILYDLSKTLKEISERATESFTGIGILVYDEPFNYDEYCMGMQPSEKCPKGKYLGEPDTIEYLIDLSKKSNPLHDGFTLFDGPELTHLSQWFSPPKVKTVKADERYGSRFHTALCGAYLKGVDAIGTISTNGDYFIFKKLLEQNGVKIMDSDIIKEYIARYEDAMKYIDVKYDIPPRIKQIAMFLILVHIFKNPFALHIAPENFALGFKGILS